MRRIELIDLWRSLCVFAMIAYHTLYDLAMLGAISEVTLRTAPVLAVRLIAMLGFILISGISAGLSGSGIRRGFFVLCAGLGVSIVSALAGMPVKFGILQLLGCSMIIYGAARDRIDRLGDALPWLCAVLFCAGLYAYFNVRVSVNFLYPLGLRTPDFYSADYYPLVPWLFLFLFGTWLGGYIIKYSQAGLMNRSFPRLLTFAGRHSLAVYLLHQPVIYGVCLLALGK